MTYITLPSDIALYLRLYQIGRLLLQSVWILYQSDTVNDLILFVGHSDLYFMVVILLYISGSI